MIRIFCLATALLTGSAALAQAPTSSRTLQLSGEHYFVRDISFIQQLYVGRSGAPSFDAYAAKPLSQNTARILARAFLKADRAVTCSIGTMTEISPSFHRLNYRCD